MYINFQIHIVKKLFKEKFVIMKRTRIISACLLSVFCCNFMSTIVSAETGIEADKMNDSVLFEMGNEEFIPTSQEAIEEHLINIDDVYSTNGMSKAAVNLPDVVDLSTSKYFPPIGNQGSAGSCASFSMVYYQFTYEANKINGISSNTNSAIYSPQWPYYLAMGFVEDLYNHLADRGALHLTDDPYVAGTGGSYSPPSNESKLFAAMKTRLSKWNSYKLNGSGTPITSNKDSDLQAIKTLLNSGKVLRAETHNSFYSKNSSFGSVYYRANLSTAVGHSFVIVGYNDNVTCDVNGDGIIEAGEKGAFKIANSYGTTHGNSGYNWILYDALNKVSNISGNWEKGITYERCPAFSFHSNDNVFFDMQVSNKPLNLVAKISLENTQQQNLDISLGKAALNSTTYSMYHTSQFENIGKSTKLNMVMFFDYDALGVGFPNDLSKKWRVLFEEYNSNYVKVKNVALVDSRGDVVKNMTSSQSGTTLRYDTTTNLALGDINYSGTVNSADLTMLQNAIASDTTGTFSTLRKYLADVNGDGVINSKDTTRLMKMISGG